MTIKLRDPMSGLTHFIGIILAAIGLVLLLSGAVYADSRPFTFVYESMTMPPGAFEYEQWVTWKTDKNTDPDFDRLSGDPYALCPEGERQGPDGPDRMMPIEVIPASTIASIP